MLHQAWCKFHLQTDKRYECSDAACLSFCSWRNRGLLRSGVVMILSDSASLVCSSYVFEHGSYDKGSENRNHANDGSFIPVACALFCC
jgi:hypothetical protein